MFDVLWNTSLNNTSFKLAKIQLHSTSNSCLMFYEIHPTIHLPEDGHNTSTLNMKQLFDILRNTPFNNTSLKMATIQLHWISNSYLTLFVIHPTITLARRWPQYNYFEYQHSCLRFFVIHPSVTPPWKWPQYNYIEHQTLVWCSM